LMAMAIILGTFSVCFHEGKIQGKINETWM